MMKRAGCLPLVFLVVLCLAWHSVPVRADEDSGFADWLADFRREAAARGITDRTLSAALDELRPLPKVLEFQRRQPELKLTYRDYHDRMISDERIRTAREKLREHRDVLREIEQKYGVDSSVLTALWAVESDFGRRAGRYPVVRSLATLAHQGRRRDFFRRELLATLTIVDNGWARAEDLVGSWAGAMGVFQFIPSTMRHYAVDHDGDGRRNIFENGPDAFASAAHYLKEVRWRSGEPWGTPVELPRGFDMSLAGRETGKSPDDWLKLGVENAAGLDCPAAALVLPDGRNGPAFLVCRNFKSLLRWNRSTFFALVVGQLADRIAAGVPEEQP